MNYTDIIKGLLDHNYPSTQETSTIIINNIVLRILPLPSRPYFMRYNQLQALVISRCDLRNLLNFPKIISLKHLDLSENSLQGTLNYLMPLSELKYLNIGNNLIADSSKLLPLQTIKGLQIYFIGNPFVEIEGWKTKLKKWGLRATKQPRPLQCLSVKQQDKEQQQIHKQQQISNRMHKNNKKQELLSTYQQFIMLQPRLHQRITGHRKRLSSQFCNLEPKQQNSQQGVGSQEIGDQKGQDEGKEQDEGEEDVELQFEQLENQQFQRQSYEQYGSQSQSYPYFRSVPLLGEDIQGDNAYSDYSDD